jgi:hypothetical protein
MEHSTRTGLAILFSYQEAIYLSEFYMSLGWTNPNHTFANQFHKNVLKFAEDYEKEWEGKDTNILYRCRTCRSEYTKTAWLLAHRVCPNCKELNRHALLGPGDKL